MENKKSIQDLKNEVNKIELAKYIKEYTEKAKKLCVAYNILAEMGYNHDPEYHLEGHEDRLLICWNDKQSKYVINEMGVLHLAHKIQFVTITIL